MKNQTAREALVATINTCLDTISTVRGKLVECRERKEARWTKRSENLTGQIIGLQSAVFAMRETVRALPDAPKPGPIDLGECTLGEGKKAF